MMCAMRKAGVLSILFVVLGLGYDSDSKQYQQGRVTPRIGLLASGTPKANRAQPFLRGLRELGWIEGQNITIERRYAIENQTRLPIIAAELVRLKVDVIVVLDSRAIGPATNATKTIPIV